MEPLQNAYMFLARGGPMMVLIGICSILCVAMILERFFALRKQKVLPNHLMEQLHGLAREKKTTEVVALARASDTALGRLLSSGLGAMGQDREEFVSALELKGRKEVSILEKHLDFLGTLAAVGPLLGLLGTVTGMIRTFGVIRVIGVGDPFRLSGGIAEALVSTAGGLAVGITALVFQRYFYNRVDKYVIEMEEFSQHVLNLLKGEKAA